MERIKLTVVMLLWGSIGIFTRCINLSPVMIAFLRAVISLPLLWIIIKMKDVGQKIVIKEAIPYLISGVMLGLAWAALFYGYKKMSISTAIVIYNMCPVYVMILSPLVLKEKISNLQKIVIGISFVGLLLVIGITRLDNGQMTGAIFSGISGILYACIVMMNRWNRTKTSYTKATFVQMVAATIILLPCIALEGDINGILSLDPVGYVFILVLGIVHTGIAYSLYFSVYDKMSSMEIATYSYLEPAFGIILSLLVLREMMTLSQVIGAGLILGSTYLGEYAKSRKLSRAV